MLLHTLLHPKINKEDPPVWAEHRAAFKKAGAAVDLQPMERFAFYRAAGAPGHALTIQTADQGLFANLLLTMGVRKP